MGTASVRAVLSGFAALALVGTAQLANAANVMRIGVNELEFKWAAGGGSPDGYLVSRSNKGGPLQAFAWVTEPRLVMPVAPGDTIAISVAPASRNSDGTLFMGPASVESDRIWVLPAPAFPIGGEWLLRCATCRTLSQRSLSNAGVELARVASPPANWRPLGRALLDDASDYLLWYNGATGGMVAWDAIDLTPVPGLSGMIGSMPLRGVGPADFDGDGIQEFVVQRTDTGQVLLVGARSTGLALVASLPAPSGAELVAARDFTRDGKIDFIWRSYAAGTAMLQSVLVDPKQNPPFSQLYAPPRVLATGVPSSSIVASTGDYNGDQWIDLLWRAADGRLQAQYLVNGVPSSAADLGFFTDDGSRIVVGSSDLDGVPGDEIALQHAFNKEMSVVFPIKTGTAQRLKWLHPGAQWRALKWDS
jgi:hypothetical protein